MSRVLAFIQNLSLDVTTGAVVSSLFICKCFGVEATFEMMLGLAIAIWLIYTIDHLRDASKNQGEMINPRHLFHQKYMNPIVGTATVVFVTGAVNALQLPANTILAGLILGALTGLYFIYLHFSREHRFKELFAAVIYTGGIFAAPLSLINTWNWSYLMIFISFFLLVAANLVLFPLYEAEMDSRQGLKSIALNRGKRNTVRLVAMLLCLNLASLLLLIFVFTVPANAPFVFVAMNGILLLLLIKMDWFEPHQLYRWLGDGIFLIPALAFFW